MPRLLPYPGPRQRFSGMPGLSAATAQPGAHSLRTSAIHTVSLLVQMRKGAAVSRRPGAVAAYSLLWAMALASSFLCSRVPWRAIMMRWAWGEPAPCMDSVR